MRSVMKYISSDSMLLVLSNDVLIVVVSWLYPNGITELAVKLCYTVSLGHWSHGRFSWLLFWDEGSRVDVDENYVVISGAGQGWCLYDFVGEGWVRGEEEIQGVFFPGCNVHHLRDRHVIGEL